MRTANSYQRRQRESGGQNEERLRELLDVVAPSDADETKQGNDDAVQLLGAVLTDEILATVIRARPPDTKIIVLFCLHLVWYSKSNLSNLNGCAYQIHLINTYHVGLNIEHFTALF